MASFKELGVKTYFIKALDELGIKNPSEIQEKSIPILIKSDTDFIGLAQTGTGKTAAYGLPVLHKIDSNLNEIQALILSPTRELVQQIKNLKRTTHIVIATPGRLIDLIERGEIDIKNIKTLVLDEADEMLSMGFKQDLNRILRYTSGSRNTWLFSATMPDGIRQIIKNYMSNKAVTIEVNKNSLVNANITHQFIKTSIKKKLDVLIKLLNTRHNDRGIIFCKTKLGTQNLTYKLKDAGFSVAALEGNMQQRDREKAMRAFKNGSLKILVSTDVSARGIDVNNLGFVIHHQLPEQIEYYTHRSGRTARAGKTGYSIALILPSELQHIHELQKTLGIKFVEI